MSCGYSHYFSWRKKLLGNLYYFLPTHKLTTLRLDVWFSMGQYGPGITNPLEHGNLQRKRYRTITYWTILNIMHYSMLSLTCTHTIMHAYTHANMHAGRHTHTHTHTHTVIHTHTHTQ